MRWVGFRFLIRVIWRTHQYLGRNHLLHEDAERIVRIVPKRAAPRVPAACVKAQRLGLTGAAFKFEQTAAARLGVGFQYRQYLARHTRPSMVGVHIHAFYLPVVCVEHDRAAADGYTCVVPRNGKNHIRLLERCQIKCMSTFGRIKRVLIGIQLGNELDDVGLVG